MRQSTLVLLLLGVYFALGQKNGFCNLVWSDEFNGNTLNSAWTKEQTCYGGGNNELQCYTPRDKNIYLENGNLVLRAYKEQYTGSQNGCTDVQGCTWTKGYTSGRVNTARSASWTYGRFETRAQLAKGSHLWPAIWMMPVDYAYGGWAASGEIDIMEARGNHPDLISGTLHHGGAWPRNVWTSSGDKSIGRDLSSEFHVYAFEWTPQTMKWYLDDYNFYTLDTQRWWNTSSNGPYWARGQPFDRRFHFILNLAVGGSYFGGYPQLTDDAQAQWSNPTMKVDYVRVWSQGGQCNGNPTSNNNDNGNRPTTSSNNPTPSTSNGNNQPGTCNGQVYNSNSYTCTINEQGKQVLCPSGNSACGTACFSANNYCCENGNLKPKGQCAAVTTKATTSSTTKATTSSTTTSSTTTSSTTTSSTTSSKPATSQTTSSTTRATTTSTPATSAPNQPTTCNGQAYGSGYVCNLNDQGKYMLCPSDHPYGCGQACYNPNNYCCKNSALRAKGTC